MKLGKCRKLRKLKLICLVYVSRIVLLLFLRRRWCDKAHDAKCLGLASIVGLSASLGSPAVSGEASTKLLLSFY